MTPRYVSQDKAEMARSRIRFYHDKGLPLSEMSKAMGGYPSTSALYYQIYERRVSMSTVTWEAVMLAEFVPPDPEVLEWRARKRHWNAARLAGKPHRMKGVEVERAQAKVRDFHSRGMTYQQMSDATGLKQATVWGIGTQERPSMLRSSYERVMAMEFRPPGRWGAHVSPVGPKRRMQALHAEGYPIPFLAKELGIWNEAHIRKFMRLPFKYIQGNTAREIGEMYERLLATTPEKEGVIKASITRSIRASARNGYAPWHCWDTDTIDDPDAIPNWTGKCGSSHGYYIHRRDGIPICDPCRDAKTAQRKGRYGREVLDRQGGAAA